MAQPLLDAAVPSSAAHAILDVEPLLAALRLGVLDDHLEQPPSSTTASPL